MNLLDFATHVFSSPRAFYVAKGMPSDFAPRRIILEGLGELRLRPMLQNLSDGQYVEYRVDREHKGVQVERYVPRPASFIGRKHVPQVAANQHAWSPRTVALLAGVIPLLGFWAGTVAVAATNQAVVVVCLLGVAILCVLAATWAVKLVEQYHCAPAITRYKAPA